MSQQSELTADLREIIQCDEGAQVSVTVNGKQIVGTRGNILNQTIYDRDGGGINTDSDLTATFILSDWPTIPIGDEVVGLDGEEKRILRCTQDDLGVALIIDFASVTAI